MRARHLLRSVAVLAVAALAVVALPRQPEPLAGQSSTTATIPGLTGHGAPPPTLPPSRTAPPTTNPSRDQPLEPGDSQPPVPVAATNPVYHPPPPAQPDLVVPCDDNGRPADLGDPRCVARWTIFHVVANLADRLDPQWVDPVLLGELGTARPRDEDQQPNELLVLDSAGPLDQAGPGKAQLEVIVERAWSTGQLDHLFYKVTLLIGPQGTWIVATIHPG